MKSWKPFWLNIFRLVSFNMRFESSFHLADLSKGLEGQLNDGKARKGLNTTSGAQFPALPLIKPVV